MSKSIYNIPQVRAVPTSAITSLNQLTNVQITGVTNNQGLVFDNTLGKWTNKNIVNSFNGRAGTVVSATNDYAISQIQNSSVLANSANIDIVSPTNNQILRYNSAATKWQNSDAQPYNTVYTFSNNITAVPNTNYIMNSGGTLTVNQMAVGSFLQVSSNSNTINIQFPGSFLINTYLAGGTVSPTLTIFNACVEFCQIFNGFQSYFELRSLAIIRPGGSITLNGQKISALASIANITDVNITSPVLNQVLRYDGSAWVNGTVSAGITSIALAMPIEFSVSGSPLTANGTITVAKNNAAANSFYMGPNGSAGQPVFRTIQNSDLDAGGVTYMRTFNGRTGNVVPVEGDYNLNLLQDVTISSPVTNQVLQYNGAGWQNATLAAPSVALNDLTDVTITSVQNAQTLVYDSPTSQWINAVPYYSRFETYNVADTYNLSAGRVYSFAGFTGTCNLFLPTAGTGDRIKIFLGNSVTAVIWILDNLLDQTGSANNITLTQIGGVAEFTGIANSIWSGKYNGTFTGNNGRYYQDNFRNPIIFNSAGLLANTPRFWIGTATTNASGVFTVSIASAGFNSVLNTQVSAVLNASTASNAPIATIQSASTTTVTGLCVESNTVSALGQQGLVNTPANIVVNIMVIGI